MRGGNGGSGGGVGGRWGVGMLVGGCDVLYCIRWRSSIAGRASEVGFNLHMCLFSMECVGHFESVFVPQV